MASVVGAGSTTGATASTFVTIAGASVGLTFAGTTTAASSALISASRSAFSRYGMNALLKPAMMMSLIWPKLHP